MIRFIFVLLLALSAHASAAGLYKWVDDKGVTHYGDVKPSDANKPTPAASGEERKTQEDLAAKKREADKKEEERRRRDAALLDTYGSEKEIDAARDRNLQSSQLAADSTQMRIKSSQARLDGMRKQADFATKNKKPMPAGLAEDIKATEAEIAQLQANLTRHKQEIEAIRTRFDEDKKRYRELRGDAATPH